MTIEQLHKDHQEWSSKLHFYQDEIRFFFKELNSVFAKDMVSLSKMELIDEYETILDHNLEKTTALLNRIAEHEKQLALNTSSTVPQLDHELLSKEVQDYSNSFETVKRAFKRFSSHND